MQFTKIQLNRKRVLKKIKAQEYATKDFTDYVRKECDKLIKQINENLLIHCYKYN